LLDGSPDSRGSCLPIGELGHGLDAGQAIPDLQKPLVVGADQVGELFFGCKDPSPGIAGGFAGSMDRDVVFGVGLVSLGERRFVGEVSRRG
jgi:hypothetical protein